MLTRLRPGAGAVSFGLVAAVVAALLAHVVIDVVGDVALARDAYDGFSHASRTLAILGLLGGTLALAVRFVVSAIGAPSRRERGVRRGPSPVTFILGVIVGSTLVLLAMESFDAVAATGRLADFDDAFGGSPLLGLAVLIPAAVACALAALQTLRWIDASHDDLVRAISAAFTLESRGIQNVAAAIGAEARPLERPSVLLHRAAKRGPPLSPSA